MSASFNCGAFWAAHVVPPSVVTSTVPEVARQVETEAQEMLTPPPDVVWSTQVTPPSVVLQVPWTLVATQSVIDGQETPRRVTVALVRMTGTVWLTQLLPPSEVVTMLSGPTATQLLTDAHETPERSVP
jgi:hypothetical protein